MHMIIVGCGRVGSTIAKELQSQGHDVVVIDRKKDAFRRLGEDFAGRTVTGIGFDRTVLQETGITPNSAVMAVTSGDNSNIMIARVAREMFGVQRVAARIYDPKRAAVYQRLGIATVATVAWTSNQILSIVMPHESAPMWNSPTSTHFIVERHVQASTAGRAIDEFTTDECRIVLLGRNGVSQIPPTTVLLQEGDVLHVLATTSGIKTFDHAFTAHQGSHS